MYGISDLNYKNVKNSVYSGLRQVAIFIQLKVIEALALKHDDGRLRTSAEGWLFKTIHEMTGVNE